MTTLLHFWQACPDIAKAAVVYLAAVVAWIVIGLTALRFQN